ncbi:MAG: hypothetical protein AAGI27_15345 [Pseudomonadota bacterium]
MKTLATLFILSGTLVSAAASAHLMVAQRGTLNVVDDTAYMVLSVPMSAFDGIDDNGDGTVSMVEFNWHREDILEAVRNNVYLDDGRGNQSPANIVLSPVRSHHETEPTAPATQLVVMGQFALAMSTGPLDVVVTLFGDNGDERSLQITAIRRASNERQVLELSPEHASGRFFDEEGADS